MPTPALVVLHLQEVDTDANLKALSALLALTEHQRQAEVQFESSNRMGIDQTDTDGARRQARGQVVEGIVHATRDASGAEASSLLLAVALGLVLQRHEPATVGEDLEAKSRVGALVGQGEEHVHASGSKEVSADSVRAVVGTEATKVEAANVGRTAELEPIVDAAGLGLAFGGEAERKRVEHAEAEASSDGDTGTALNAGQRDGDSATNLALALGEGDVSGERTNTCELEDGLEQVAALRELHVVSRIARVCVLDGALDGVPGVGAD